MITPLTTRRVSTDPPTSTPTSQPTSCQDVSCVDGQECIEFPVDFVPGVYSGPTCFTIVRPNCGELSCGFHETCLTQTIPAVGLTAASCILTSILPFLNTSDICNDDNCGDGDSGCIVSMHPSIVTSSVCLQFGFNVTVQVIDFILNQFPTGSPTATPFTIPLTTRRVSTDPPTSTPTSQPTTCQGVSCVDGQECIEFPIDFVPGLYSGPTCFSIVRLNCG